MTYDVIIAGGGVAGAAGAAALTEFGFRVLVVEPGLDHGRRLAGELIHPPGVNHLRELGLIDGLMRAGAVPVLGFVVFPGADSTTALLPYAETGNVTKQGLAIEHGTLAQKLLNSVTTIPRVTVARGARITALDLSEPNSASVTISHEGRQSRETASLIIAADGRNSHTRRLAGIAHRQAHISDMMGYLVKQSRLPQPGFGHVFAGGPAPSLAYAIAADTTRIMFDIASASPDMRPYLNALPQPFRTEVEQAMIDQTPLRAANVSIIPETVFKERFVCLGDAGGCCHPLTATGLSACARDAILLRQALRETQSDINRALPRYAHLRQGPQKTRLSGAKVLYDVFKGDTPEMRMMRDGLLRYWRQSPRGRTTTMALLSTEEDRLHIMVREYLHVCRYVLPELIHSPVSAIRGQAMFRLSRVLIRLIGEACGITQQT